MIGFVYILASCYNGTLYIGVTSDIVKRVHQHKHKQADGFTKKYKIEKLVYFETHDNLASARLREKQMKKWNRVWKIRLIESLNPNWLDLYKNIV